MYDDRLFFQLAAGLIPALLFGGLITGAFGPPPQLRERSFRVGAAYLALATLAVGVAVLAEFFAIDLATSPERPSTLKIVVVVITVVGATALAGAALLRPWVQELAAPHEFPISQLLVSGGVLLFAIGGSVFIGSIADAERRLSEQRAICFEAESSRQIRDLRNDSFAARDAVDARWADVLSLSEEQVKLRQEKGLSRAERRARVNALRERAEHAAQRWKYAGEHYSNVVLRNELDRAIERAAREARGRSQDEIIERFTRAFGC